MESIRKTKSSARARFGSMAAAVGVLRPEPLVGLLK
jgi:hypothetical protein